MRARLALGAVGVLAGLFGLLRLLQRGFGDVVDAVVWLAGGVLLHDAVLAPLTLAVTWVGVRVVPPRWRSRVLVAAIVLVTVTLSAVPVLTRAGARADNTTLLDRPYWWGWGALVLVVLVAALVLPLVRRLARSSR